MIEEQKHYGVVRIARYLRFVKAEKFASGKILDGGYSDGAFFSLFRECDDIIGIDTDNGKLETAQKFERLFMAMQQTCLSIMKPLILRLLWRASST